MTGTVKLESLAEARRWARETLKISPDAVQPKAEAELLARLEECEFSPPDSWREAMLVLASPQSGEARVLPLQAFKEFQQNQLREEIEQLAREFFSLAPSERQDRWRRLIDHPAITAPMELRLRSLALGMQVSPGAVAGDDAATQLAEKVAELAVLPLRQRAELRRSTLREMSADIRRWAGAAKRLRNSNPPLAALAPDFLDELIHWKKRRRKSVWRRKLKEGSVATAVSPVTTEQKKPVVWPWILAIIVAVNILRAMLSGTPEPAYKAPSYTLPPALIPPGSRFERETPSFTTDGKFDERKFQEWLDSFRKRNSIKSDEPWRVLPRKEGVTPKVDSPPPLPPIPDSLPPR
jgi:hypothetical protein